MKLSKRLKVFRSERKITQQELADKSGIHPVTIRKYETDKLEPKLDHITKLAHALNTSIPNLLGFDNIKLTASTLGDLYALIISLCKANILKIHISDKNVEFVLESNISRLFCKNDGESIIEVVSFTIKNIDEAFISWSKLLEQYQSDSFLDISDQERKNIKDEMECLEIKLTSIENKL